jgi:hypothetical protein
MGQTERVNQVIEDMLRMYVMNKPSKWEDYLHLVDFSYNNGYQVLVYKYVQCISYTHLYVNPGFIIKRVVTLYVPRTGNLPMSVVYRK